MAKAMRTLCPLFLYHRVLMMTRLKGIRRCFISVGAVSTHGKVALMVSLIRALQGSFLIIS